MLCINTKPSLHKSNEENHRERPLHIYNDQDFTSRLCFINKAFYNLLDRMIWLRDEADSADMDLR